MKALLVTTFSLISSFSFAQEGDNRPDPTRDRPAPRAEEDRRPDLEDLKKRIEGAMNRGEMTREQAEARMGEIRRAREAARVRPNREDAPSRPNQEREAREREEREMAQDRERAERARNEERERNHQHRERIEAIEKSLFQAVEAGLIPEIEARKTMARLHLAMIKHEQKKMRLHR